jgi:hypothetical protein
MQDLQTFSYMCLSSTKVYLVLERLRIIVTHVDGLIYVDPLVISYMYYSGFHYDLHLIQDT